MKTVPTRNAQTHTSPKVGSAKSNAVARPGKGRRTSRAARKLRKINLLAGLEKLSYTEDVGQAALAKYHDSIY
jgi:hypothetical protein